MSGLADVARAMGDCLVHRGPDGSGVWADDAAGVALAHRRLSILELSPAGHQPMVSATGRYVLTFNGEIYNHLELRRALEEEGVSRPWRGRSDTETLLAACEAWTPEAALKRSVGMFALALWDRSSRELLLARDRLGEKPLYYGWQKGSLLFASELKALSAHPTFERRVDRDALTLFLRHNYVPAPFSVYDNIRKLPAGSLIRLSANQRDAQPRPYWSALDACNAGLETPFDGTLDEAQDELTRRLQASIAGQMVADVPVGAFLSGGIDSTLVVALMQSLSSDPVRTFTIGFADEDFNEAGYAARAAKALGTTHTELYVSPQQALDVIPDLARIYDEPFADSSQVPTILISRLARQQVTVSLSGDGGDELFGGYTRYSLGLQAWRKFASMPGWTRRALIWATENIPMACWNRAYGITSWLVPRHLRQSNPGDKIRKLGDALKVATPEAVYLGLVSHWTAPEAVVIDGVEHPTVQRAGATGLRQSSFIEQMMYVDLVTYLPDDVLCKVDRAAMSVSLETRVPFLDHRVVEFAWSLPLEYRITRESGKRVLRNILGRHVPREIFERPKMGFGIPVQAWLRGPLRPWAEELLSESRLRRDGYFRPRPVRERWNEHLSGRRDWGYHLWDVLMFQAWLDVQAASG
jgi:asparagine synthase (glutamine-hydrolysing)